MEITFETLPSAVNQLNDRLINIERLLSEKNQGTIQQSEDILTVPEVAEFLTVSIPTIYALTSKGEIPHFKRGRRVYFSKEEVVKFLKKGRKKTKADLQQEASDYLNKTGRKHG